MRHMCTGLPSLRTLGSKLGLKDTACSDPLLTLNKLNLVVYISCPLHVKVAEPQGG